MDDVRGGRRGGVLTSKDSGGSVWRLPENDS
jgi:hypothetical protein